MITIIGTDGIQGIYLLRMVLAHETTVTFGRFAGGRQFLLSAGDYLYVGSAMGQRGATTLAGRLLRHATRSGTQPCQPIRGALYQALEEANLSPKLPLRKRCHWHIDYLLDQAVVSLWSIYALRTTNQVESRLARQLMVAAETTIPIPRVGASDDPGATHLLRVDAPEVWWHTLPSLLQEMS